MYVRWKRTKLKRRIRWGEDPGFRLSAELVEYQRVDGRPRQRYVKYLGSIPERNIAYGGWPAVFWKHADAALTSLKLPDDERERIAAQVESRVPRPIAEAGPSLAELEAHSARARR